MVSPTAFQPHPKLLQINIVCKLCPILIQKDFHFLSILHISNENDVGDIDKGWVRLREMLR